MPERNPPWERDELILALDQYFRRKPTTFGKDHPDVLALSTVLNALPIHKDRPDKARLRNANGLVRGIVDRATEMNKGSACKQSYCNVRTN